MRQSPRSLKSTNFCRIFYRTLTNFLGVFLTSLSNKSLLQIFSDSFMILSQVFHRLSFNGSFVLHSRFNPLLMQQVSLIVYSFLLNSRLAIVAIHRVYSVCSPDLFTRLIHCIDSVEWRFISRRQLDADNCSMDHWRIVNNRPSASILFDSRRRCSGVKRPSVRDSCQTLPDKLSVIMNFCQRTLFLRHFFRTETLPTRVIIENIRQRAKIRNFILIFLLSSYFLHRRLDDQLAQS